MDERFNQTDEQEQRLSDRGARISRLFNENYQQTQPQSQAQPTQPQQEFTQQYQRPLQTANNGIILNNPKSYEDVRVLIDHLKNREQIIVDFSDVNQDIACRILDFMSGAVYALNGTIQEIKKNLFIFAPSGISISVPESFR